jgi:nucleoid-associated protein YgaU
MKRLIVSITVLLFLGSGCAPPPNHELKNARQALANAYAVGAEDVAEIEYLAAEAALRHAEELVRQGNFQAARELLPYATAQARRASEQAVATKHELAKRQAEKLAAEREQREAEQKSHKLAPAVVKPAPVVKVPVQKLSSYQVTTEESLWQIAARDAVYADGSLWPLLYKANRDQIKDPRKVYPGQTLDIPRTSIQKELDEARQEAIDSGIFPLQRN